MILLSLILTFGCGKKVRPVTVNTCPVDKIPELKGPDLGAIKGYRKLKPGKQEITVGKPFGALFPGQAFNQLEYDNALKNHYADALREQITKHNATLEKWRKSIIPPK